MVFYQSIADYYDDIFPLNPSQVDFILKSINGPAGKRLLDVGCGTGNLCIALAADFKHITGIDPDESMLDKAKMKAGVIENISWYNAGMLDLDEKFDAGSFDTVLCFGNTLPHLGSEEEIREFLRQAKKVLKPGGKLMIQIINYDRIIDRGIQGLPTLENDNIKFIRNYHWSLNGDPIDFETVLSVKSTGLEVRNSIKLYPVRKAALEQLLSDTGYNRMDFYGNFKRDALAEMSIPLIVEACL